MTTGPAAVLWDMDGTLVDSEKVWTVSLQDTARVLGGELSAAARSAVVGSDLPHTLDVLFDDLGLPREAARLAEAERLLNQRTAELFDGGLEWRPGALAALHTVRAAGWPTALVTNTGRALTERALDVIGREHFQATVCGDEVPAGKPHPAPYLRAADLLGVSARGLPGRGGLAHRGAGRRARRDRGAGGARARNRSPAGPGASCGRRWPA